MTGLIAHEYMHGWGHNDDNNNNNVLYIFMMRSNEKHHGTITAPSEMEIERETWVSCVCMCVRGHVCMCRDGDGE